MTNEAVKKATGKVWKEWFTILDKAGAKHLDHRGIYDVVYKRHLSKKKHVNAGWWSQMVTVEYERARGKRQVNEVAGGFLVAVHKTLPTSLTALEKSWHKLTELPEVKKKGLERLPTKSKRAIIRYKAKVGGVVVNFDERTNGKSRIMVEAIKLPTKTGVEKERAFWKKILERLDA